MLLIREFNDDECVALTEDVGDKKHYFIEGIFMQGNIKNRNGRVYPSELLEGEMLRYRVSHISDNRAVGELGHPEGPKINEDRISHKIVEMSRDGDNFYGKARILSTPTGLIAKTLMEEGVKIGVSTRGLGNVQKSYNGLMEVKQFHLVTVDIVADPSGPDCFVNGIMENTQYYYDIASGNWLAQNMIENTVKEFKEDYKQTVRKFDEAKVVAAFSNFMESLKNPKV